MRMVHCHRRTVRVSGEGSIEGEQCWETVAAGWFPLLARHAWGESPRVGNFLRPYPILSTTLAPLDLTTCAHGGPASPAAVLLKSFRVCIEVCFIKRNGLLLRITSPYQFHDLQRRAELCPVPQPMRMQS